MLRIGDGADQMRRVKRRIDMLKHSEFKRSRTIKAQVFDIFGEERIKPYFKVYVGYRNLCKGAHNYSLVLLGSDQLLTPMSLYSKYYNLLFVDDSIPKVAYAASFGVSDIPSFQKKQTGEYLNRFTKIGVREKSGKKIVESLSERKAQQVMDPSML